MSVCPKQIVLVLRIKAGQSLHLLQFERFSMSSVELRRLLTRAKRMTEIDDYTVRPTAKSITKLRLLKLTVLLLRHLNSACWCS